MPFFMLKKMAKRIIPNVTKVVRKAQKPNKGVAVKMAVDKFTQSLDTGKKLAVKSTNIKDIEYNKDLKDLTITFLSGNRKYVYYNVSSILHSKFISSSSKGVFFHRFIAKRFKFAEIKGGKK